MLIKGSPEVLFAPKTPGAFGGLGLSDSDLPTNWSTYSPAQKISFFNENLITPNELLDAGVAQADINWMILNGYDVQNIELQLEDEARLRAEADAAAEAARIAAAQIAAERAAAEAARIAAQRAADEAFRIAAERAAAENARIAAETAAAEAERIATIRADAERAAAEAARPVMVGNVILPSDWSRYSPDEKISFFNANLITPEQLLQAGVPQSDIDWMIRNGYLPEPEIIVEPIEFFTDTKNDKESTMLPIMIGNVTLPNNWETFTATQKIVFFNKNSISEKMLLDAGVSIDDITWMKANGYTGKPETYMLPRALAPTTPQTNTALPLILAAAAAYLIGG